MGFENTQVASVESSDQLEQDFEVPADVWRDIETTVRLVGNDYGVKVELGGIQGFTGFSPDQDKISFNKLHVIEDPKRARFIAAHEIGHKVVDPSVEKIGLSIEKIREWFSKPGFAALHNYIEDCVVNTWVSNKHPGLKTTIDEQYDEMFNKDGAVLHNPQTVQVMRAIGRAPKFAQYGSEIMRLWHTGRFSDDLDPDVREALERTKGSAIRAYELVPDINASRGQVIRDTQDRFTIMANDLYPEVANLIEKDIHIDSLRRMYNGVSAVEQRKAILDAEILQANGNIARLAELSRVKLSFEDLTKIFEDFPQEAKDEIKEKSDRAIQEVVEDLEEGRGELKAKIEQAKEAQLALKTSLQEVEDKLSDPQLDRLQRDKLTAQERQLTNQLKIEALKEGIHTRSFQGIDQSKAGYEHRVSSGDRPLPYEQLSPPTRRALEELYEKASGWLKKFLEEHAKELLEEIEKLEVEETAKRVAKPKDLPTTDIDLPSSNNPSFQGGGKDLQGKLDEMREQNLNPFDKEKRKFGGAIDDLYLYLRKIYRPTEYGEEDDGYPSGTMVDFNRAMQSDPNPEQLNKLYIRENDPGIFDARFVHLVDLSSSMDGPKINNTFSGVAIAASALDRAEDLNSNMVSIRQGIVGFHQRVFEYKNTKQRLSTEVQRSVSTILDRVDDTDATTNTLAGVEAAMKMVRSDLGLSSNFILVYTDGDPNRAVIDPLIELLKNGKSIRDQQHIKIGMIWLSGSFNRDAYQSKLSMYGDELGTQRFEELSNTEHEDYTKATMDLYKEVFGYDFALHMPAEPAAENEDGSETDEANSKGGRDFANSLGRLVEDLVDNPEKY